MSDLSDQEAQVLAHLREVQQHGFGRVEVTVREGKVVSVAKTTTHQIQAEHPPKKEAYR